ncbi:MAG: radical SAM protein [Spirochaetales bacterium]|jgi:anaerobic ribonucleoside-triphosphate reductase activating protein|nr:radical SAM protein [Spirochaetales bacterium]
MLIHAILPFSRVNGPGERFTVWTQGCSRGCEGCFNPLTHGKSVLGATLFPIELSVEEIIARIPRGKVSGISVSGGEPFEQPEELFKLLAAARKLNLHTLVYSGFTYEELRKTARDILCEIDMLIDGPFIRGIRGTSPWAGSGNQRILCLKDGEIIPGENYFQRHSEAEIFIDAEGSITETGLFSFWSET